MLIVWTGAQAQPLRKIRIGYPSISSRQAQLWVAKDEGIFRKHGLDVELIFLFPWAVVVKQVGWLALVEIVIFFFILFMGFLYAHKKGALKWM